MLGRVKLCPPTTVNGPLNARQGFGEDNNKALAAHISLRNSDALSVGLGIYSSAYDDADGWAVGIGFVF